MLAAAVVDEADRVTKSRRRTIFGFRRRAIEQTDPSPGPAPGRKMRNFLRRTKLIQTEKAQHHVWTGCEGEIQLRPKAKAQSRMDRIRSCALRLLSSASPRGTDAKRREPSSLRSTPAAKRKAKASSQSSTPVSALASSQSSLPARSHIVQQYQRMKHKTKKQKQAAKSAADTVRTRWERLRASATGVC